MEKIGFIGLGMMGLHMARHLMKAGFQLVVFDVNAEPVNTLVAEGAQAAASPAELASQVDAIHLSLPESAQVTEVATGENGIACGARSGLIVIDHSTVAPSTPQAMAASFQKTGCFWIDAPVSGGPHGAEAASLTIMVGGDEMAYQKVRPQLDALGKNLEYMGDSGTGAMTKLVNNLAAGIGIVAVSEALTLGAAAGIDPERLYDVMSKSSAASWVLENLVPAIVLANEVDTEPAPRFALRLMHKDLSLAVAAASDLKAPLAAGSLAEQMFAVAEGQGMGNKDHMSLIKLYSDAAGIKAW